jgi:hypothetical protein
MSVCIYSVFVLSCVDSGLGTGLIPVQGTEVRRSISQMFSAPEVATGSTARFMARCENRLLVPEARSIAGQIL